MNNGIQINKDGIVIPRIDTVTIPRSEYNELIAAKTVNDLLLATSDDSGYGCSYIIQGMQKLDKYRRALTEYRREIAELVKEIADLKSHAENPADKEPVASSPEDAPDAE